MAGAADLLVKQGLTRRDLDLVVETERDLTQEPGALIGVQRTFEMLQAGVGVGL